MSGNTYPPVPLTISGSKGYIWEAEGARWLRQRCRLMGALTGNPAENKQHKSAGGLPFELGLEELALALQEGWVAWARTPSSTLSETGTSQSTLNAAPQAPAWLTAIISKQPVTIPVSTFAQQSKESGFMCPSQQDVASTGPAACKLTIFSHLHKSGYYITDGSKFGADYLLYPGDPLLYHAQFTVRVVRPDTAIKPALLIGAARGSHSARKHLLLASANTSSVSWITIAPEGGFGLTG